MYINASAALQNGTGFMQSVYTVFSGQQTTAALQLVTLGDSLLGRVLSGQVRHVTVGDHNVTSWRNGPIGLLVHTIRSADTTAHFLPAAPFARPPASTMILLQRTLTVPNIAMPFTASIGHVFAAVDVCPSAEAAFQSPNSTGSTGCQTAAFVLLAVEDSPTILVHRFTGIIRFIFSDTSVV